MEKSLPSHTKSLIWLLSAGAFFAFFIFGFTDNLKGPTLPALLDDLNLNYSLGGTILLGIYLGFMAATLSTGLLADALGHKAVLVLAGVCLAVGVTSFAAFSSPLLLTLSMAVLGFGLGSIELGCNSLIVLLHPADKGRYLNLMAVLHGMGSMIAPLYAGWLLAGESSWRTVYRWDLVLIIPLIIFFTLAVFPKKSTETSEKIDFKHIGRTAFSPIMLAYYFADLLYVALEIGIASWMVEFLQKDRAQSVTQSTLALSVFFGLIMVGRFVGSFFVERFGYLRSILLAALAASACVGISLFGPALLWWLLPASGFFLSIIFPTITASISGRIKGNMNTILGLLFTFAGLGGIIGPWLVGLASDLGGIRFGFSLNLAFGLLTAGMAFILLRLQSKNESGPPSLNLKTTTRD
jgi:FHS family glucose/mannose:H+ symporter-like MFS transporter